MLLLHSAQVGAGPIDFLSYARAVTALQRGESPYPAPSESLAIWTRYHAAEGELLSAYAHGEGGKLVREMFSQPPLPGPYQYPPTLALLIAQLGVSAINFGALTLLAVIGFAWLWLRYTHAHPAWLLILPLSRDVSASLQGANVEILLLFVGLVAARLIWDTRLLVAAPLIAMAMLIKPFYLFFFVAFVVLRQASAQHSALTMRSILVAAAVVLGLVGLEITRWDKSLQMQALGFFVHASDSLWFALPISEQTPMSAWNRTPLQALVNVGASFGVAQAAAALLWLLLLATTGWRLYKYHIHLTFARAFALALTLLYLARPVGWGFIYLEWCVLMAVWPSLVRWHKIVLLAAVFVLFATRWWALVLALRGAGLPLLTLQGAHLPWETLLVLPLAWLLSRPADT